MSASNDTVSETDMDNQTHGAPDTHGNDGAETTTVVHSAAFDSAADGYDNVAMSDLGLVLRRRVHERIAPLVRSGTRLLDLGCGTGLDARWAADRGADVVAVDASAQMIRHAASRLGEAARVRIGDLDSEGWVKGLGDPFDLALANFGVVSCLDDLAGLGRQLESVLVDGGVAVLVPMSRVVPWEQAPALARFDFALARRRFGRRSIGVDDELDARVLYHTGRSLIAAFGRRWRLVSVEALGWALPTYERRAAVQGRPKLLSVLASLDKFGAGPLGRIGFGDHQIVVLERRREPQELP